MPDQPVVGLERVGDRVVGVRTRSGSIGCGSVVMAAGAWSGGLLAEAAVDAPTPPLKGQIVLLRAPENPIRRIVEHGKNYLVPRLDGLILVGATEEDAGFDVLPTANAHRGLLEWAGRICPVLNGSAVEATWAGLRPGTRDTRPYLGRAPGFANLMVATGHKRAGLQLAPATAEVIADLVLGRPPRMDLTPFRLDRPFDAGADRDDDAFRS